MTDKSATERLREMLDERGVEYETDDRNGLRETIWCGTAAFQLSPIAKMTMIVTPEQAIAATLGGDFVHEEIVRCRDCKHCETVEGMFGGESLACGRFDDATVKPDGFCAWGELRGDAE